MLENKAKDAHPACDRPDICSLVKRQNAHAFSEFFCARVRVSRAGTSEDALLDANVKVHRNMNQNGPVSPRNRGFIFYTEGKVLLTSSLPGRKLSPAL